MTSASPLPRTPRIIPASASAVDAVGCISTMSPAFARVTIRICSTDAGGFLQSIVSSDQSTSMRFAISGSG